MENMTNETTKPVWMSDKYVADKCELCHHTIGYGRFWASGKPECKR